MKVGAVGYGTKRCMMFIDDMPLVEVKEIDAMPEGDMTKQIRSIGTEIQGSIEFVNTENLRKMAHCYGKKLYGIECKKCSLVNDCIKQKINNRFNRRGV